MDEKNWIFQRRLKRQTNSWWRLSSLFIRESLAALHCIRSLDGVPPSHLLLIPIWLHFTVTYYLNFCSWRCLMCSILCWCDMRNISIDTPTTHYKYLLLYYRIQPRFKLIVMSTYSTLLYPLFSAIGALHTLASGDLLCT